MRLDLTDEPRHFGVKGHEIKDYGKIFLNHDEMVSFKSGSGKEYDFVAKEWGFYATPSINSRLIKEGFKTALVVNESNQLYIMAVEKDKLDIFKKYLKNNQDNKIICWLDEFFKEEN
ncbi:hypothetical protein [Sulfurimonas sp.]|uniref:hypothetical protein n=1 Tax=Sulfurimonas sp. TaxID=2022749 RepID=UPI0026175F28|nr:hypothetical protein [Sulfurimonas sp.]MCW8895338.1 hypothetical protein [Sulfurimonas sp.]